MKKILLGKNNKRTGIEKIKYNDIKKNRTNLEFLTDLG